MLPIKESKLGTTFTSIFIAIEKGTSVINFSCKKNQKRLVLLAATELIRLNPDFFLEMDRRYSLYKDQHILETQHDDLRKAGLPEKAPSSV